LPLSFGSRLKSVYVSATLPALMNARLIRERWQQDTMPFVFRLSDGTRVRVEHPDFMMMPPGIGLVVVFDRKGRETRIDPLHVVAIEETPPKKSRSNGKRPH
jgi:hypothetical protein